MAVAGLDAIGRHAVNQLGLLAALREANRPEVALHELRHDPRRVAERARADSELGVEELGIPQRDRALRARCRVVADRRRLDAEQRVRELAGVGDRRGGEQELRLRSVHPRHASQAAKHIGDVRAEHAAVHVRLVDDDVAQVVQDVGPQVVSRQDADVEHVGIREHEVRPLPDLPAPLGRCVTVVDRGAHARHGERAERTRLVLRERLRRIEIERAVLRLARERVEHREVEGERLARRGAGRDDQVLAAAARPPTLRPGGRRARSMPCRASASRTFGMQVGRERLRARGVRRRRRQMGELVALEKVP